MSITDGYVLDCVSGGDGSCGGQDIDRLLLEYVLETYFPCNKKKKIKDDKIDYERLLLLCKQAKEELSQELEVTFEYETVSMTITRKTLNHIIVPILDKIGEAMINIFKTNSCSYQVNLLDEVVLVGGSTRMPIIHNFLRDALEFDSREKELCTSVSPEEAVAEGLAIRGAVLMGYDVGYLQSVLMMDTLPASIGLLLFDENNDKPDGKDDGENIAADEVEKKRTVGPQGIFHTAIERGMKLPCNGALTFAIDEEAIKQKFVTLSIYEDVSKEMKDIVDVKLLANDDFLLPPLCTNSSDRHMVTVEFKVSLEGKLQVKLHRGDKVVNNDNDYFGNTQGDGRGVENKDRDSDDDSKVQMHVWVLYLFLVVTVLLYLFIKLQLPVDTMLSSI